MYMKTRVTITLNPAVIRKAKNVARSRQTNLSALIEDLLIQTAHRGTKRRTKFTRKWGGKFDVRPSKGEDELLETLKRRYGLTDK
jgi:hypothetical protein